MVGRWLMVVLVTACAGGAPSDDDTSPPVETDVLDTDVAETDVAPVDTDETDVVDSDTDNIGVWDTADTGDSDGPVDDDGDGWSARADCDDTDALVFPGAAEACDGVDEDCGGDGDGTVATFEPTGAPAEDVTASLLGTTSSPRSYTVDRVGVLSLCGGPWYTRIVVTADGAQVGGVPGTVVPPVVDATGAAGAFALRVDADDVVVTDVSVTRRDGRVAEVASQVTGLSLTSVSLAGGDVAGDGGCLLVGTDAVVAGEEVLFKDCAAGGAGGGAFVSSGATLQLTDAVARDVAALRGAAVALAAGATSLSWTGGEVTDATSTDGGGGLHVAAGTVTLTDLTVQGGTAAHGGGLWVEGGTVSLTSCTLDENTVTGVGGGVEVSGGSVTVTSSSVVRGGASTGGGAYVSGGTLSLVTVDLGSGGADNNPDDVVTSGGGSEGVLAIVSLTCTASGCD